MKRWMLVLVGAVTLLIGGVKTLPLAQAKPAGAANAGGYVVIRHYHAKAGATAEVVKRAKSGFLPIISGTPGFRAWYLIDSGNDTLIAVSIFDDKAGADASTQRAADWIKKNLAELLPNAPEVSSGAVVVQKTK